MKVATTKAVDASEIKIKFLDKVAQYIKQVAIIETDKYGQKKYRINSIVYTFDDEDNR